VLNRKRPLKYGRGASGGKQVSAEKAGDQGEIGAAAVAMLARRDFCSSELTAKLREYGYSAAAVHSVVSDLIEQRFIDDARYAVHYVSYHADRGQGPLRIRRDLTSLELDAEIVETALAGEWDWSRQAREVRIRKFGLAVPSSWQAKAKQARFLQYRGFSADHIRSALGPDLDLDS
jgi:regulatory protein